MRWVIEETDPARIRALAQALGCSSVLAEILLKRGVDSAEAAAAFLRPRLHDLEDPFAITNLEAAAERLERAVEQGESVVVFGDYDVDGVTSTVQLVRLLRHFGVEPRFCVPLRLEEGYGLSREAIDRVVDGAPPDVFVALDCGTNAVASAAYLRQLGCEVLVVDHHRLKTESPPDCVLVNPHVNDRADAPWRELSTAGLVFKLLHGFLKKRRARGDARLEEVRLKDYLDLAALGTVADLVPLRGENRILSWFGLRHLRSNGRGGVRALAEVAGIGADKPLEGADIAFKLGPRINASGRLDDAVWPVRLLLSEEEEECREIARSLDRMNRDRQNIERRIVAEAERRAAAEFGDAPGIVLHDPGWHPGVVGIVAGRISRRFHKPCVILGTEGALAKGSARSVPSVNLVEVFQTCADLLGHWGGHPMAAGVSLDAANVEPFARRFADVLRTLHPDGLPPPSLEVAAVVPVEELGPAFLEELDQLHPFGQGNQQPVFGLRNVALDREPRAFGESNYRFVLPAGDSAGEPIRGVAWRMEEPPPAGEPVDMAVNFAWNHWKGRRYPQVTLIDWKPATGNSFEWRSSG